MSEPLLLIDGDILLYNSTLAAEYETRWDEDNHVLACNFEEASDAFDNQIKRITEACESKDIRIAFTKFGDATFRHLLYPGYKSGRIGNRKPLCFYRLRERALERHEGLMIEGLEADDILGIWATRPSNRDRIIVSNDKDLKTIPGRLYRQEKGKGQLMTISQSEADYYWMTQTLTGDVTDGYPGCPGVGPARATKILEAVTAELTYEMPEEALEAYWIAVVKAYEKAGLTSADALTQALCARILRASDWDATNKKPILWSPPQ